MNLRKNKKILLITFLFFLLTIAYIIFSIKILPASVITAENFEILKTNNSIDFLTVEKQLLENLKKLYPKLEIKQSPDENNIIYISEKNEIIKIKYSLLDNQQFPLRADVFANFEKKIKKLNAVDYEIEDATKHLVFIYNQKTKRWHSANISIWLIPCFVIVFFFIISLVYNLLIKPIKSLFKEKSKQIQAN